MIIKYQFKYYKRRVDKSCNYQSDLRYSVETIKANYSYSIDAVYKKAENCITQFFVGTYQSRQLLTKINYFNKNIINLQRSWLNYKKH